MMRHTADPMLSHSQHVAHALLTLGNGLLAHPRNHALRDQLAAGQVPAAEYYAQLRRLVYRLLFLLTAEARGILPSPHASAAARQRYQRSYAISRLARLPARRRGPRTASLYRNLWVVMEHLGGASDDLALGVPALGRFLHPQPALAQLADCALTDQEIIAAVQALLPVVIPESGEAGLDGEALVGLHLTLQQWLPVLPADASSFELVSADGQAHRTTTRPAVSWPLIARLLETTLAPVLASAVAELDPEAALLQLKICDPTCGTGTFLRAAARRIAEQLAMVRAGHGAPAPEVTQHALCDVIQHCLYGVDVDEPSVELCRLSLALDALASARRCRRREGRRRPAPTQSRQGPAALRRRSRGERSDLPDTSLSCLDRHIQWGDSLLGATPALLTHGIPDAAFTSVAGDDRSVATALQKRNQHERLGQMALVFRRDGVGAESEATLHTSQAAPLAARLRADAWCAAFLWPKTREAPPPVTHDGFCWLHTAPERLPAATRAMISCLAQEYHLLHWHVAFPEVFHVPLAGELPENDVAGWHGGFDVVLGKPPWQPLTGPAQPEHAEHLLQYLERSRWPGVKTQQPTALFMALYRLLLQPAGRVGCLVPARMVTAQPEVVQSLLAARRVASLYTVRNDAHLMPRLPRRTVIGLLTLTGSLCPHEVADTVWEARQLDELDDATRHVPLSAADLTLLNPNTRSWPLFRTAHAAELTRAIYRRVPILCQHGPPAQNPWGVSTAAMLHLTADAALLRTREQLQADGWQLDGVIFRQGPARYVPVYEGGMLQPWGPPAEPAVSPRYWVPYGRIVQALARVPTVLLQAYNARKADKILQALAAWFGGYHLNRGHTICTRETLAQVYNPMFQALPPTPGAWAAAPELERAWPLTPVDLALMKRQHDVLTLARHLIERHCPEWCLAWREPVDSTQAVIATVLPRVGLAQTCSMLHLATADAALTSCLLANLNSLVIDFCARQKHIGRPLTAEILYQLPIVPPTTYTEPCAWDQAMLLRDWIVPRVIELLYTTPALAPFARACGYDRAPFRGEPARRRWLRSELEAAYCLLYSLERAEVAWMLDTGVSTSPSDPASAETFALAQGLLTAYDALHQAIVTGSSYNSPVDPPPADPHLARRRHGVASGDPTGLPMHQVAPRPADRYKTCVPLLDLPTVADAFAEGEEVEPETWVVVPPGRTLRPGMFVARMIGRAMEPQIPEGAYCLFERHRDGAARHWQGRIVLVQHRDLYDPDTGGNYTVRRYAQEQRSGTSNSHQARVVRLMPLHPDYAPLVLDHVSPSERHVIAEFLAVLDAAVAQE